MSTTYMLTLQGKVTYLTALLFGLLVPVLLLVSLAIGLWQGSLNWGGTIYSIIAMAAFSGAFLYYSIATVTYIRIDTDSRQIVYSRWRKDITICIDDITQLLRGSRASFLNPTELIIVMSYTQKIILFLPFKDIDQFMNDIKALNGNVVIHGYCSL